MLDAIINIKLSFEPLWCGQVTSGGVSYCLKSGHWQLILWVLWVAAPFTFQGCLKGLWSGDFWDQFSGLIGKYATKFRWVTHIKVRTVWMSCHCPRMVWVVVLCCSLSLLSRSFLFSQVEGGRVNSGLLLAVPTGFLLFSRCACFLSDHHSTVFKDHLRILFFARLSLFDC